jgi:hypothetical protein
MKKLLKQRLSQNVTPMKLKELLAEKRRQGLLFNKTDSLHPLILNSLFSDIPSLFIVHKWEIPSFLLTGIVT